MRKITLPALLAGLTTFALPATAQVSSASATADAGIPASVFWIGGIATFLGFLIGSIPPNRGEMAGWEWDSRGALSWGLAMAGIFGGGTLFLTTGNMVLGVGGALLGAVIAGWRWTSTRPARVPTGAPIATGINRFAGDNPAARFEAAQRAYNQASFQRHPNSRFYASRSPRDLRYAAGGMPPSDMAALRAGLAGANSNTFDILVLLVSELPGEPDQAAVVVVRGAMDLRAVKAEDDGVTIPGQTKIPAKSIAGAVGYVWR